MADSSDPETHGLNAVCRHVPLGWDFKDLCMVTVYIYCICLKIYLYKKALFIFVNHVTFFSMLYQGAVEYVANTWICVYMILK